MGLAKFLSLAGLLVLLSCQSQDDVDLSKIEKGMSENQVIGLVGKPNSKANMPMNIVWWNYGENKKVIMQNKKVANVVHDVRAASKEIEEVFKGDRGLAKEE